MQISLADDKELGTESDSDPVFLVCRCGLTPGHNRTSCPAVESLCHGCKQKGHWLRMCRNEQTDVSCINSMSHKHSDSDSYEEDNYYLGCVDEDSSRPWYVGLQERFKCISFIQRDRYHKLRKVLDKDIDIINFVRRSLNFIGGILT